MKSKFLNLGLILTSLAGYMEWGGGNRMFLFQVETDVLPKLFTDFSSVVHPLVLLPLAGQLLLILTLFQKSPSRALTLLGLTGVGSLLAIMLGVGVIISNLKVILSTLPFLLISWITIHHYFVNEKTMGIHAHY